MIAAQVKVVSEDVVAVYDPSQRNAMKQGATVDVVVTAYCHCSHALKEKLEMLTLPEGAVLDKLQKQLCSSEESTEDYQKHLKQQISKKHNNAQLDKDLKSVRDCEKVLYMIELFV